jgi:formate--tetrahydrofolate ligase
MSDWDIANAARMRPIMEIAEKLGLGEHEVESHGRHMAKIDPHAGAGRPDGRLILVTAINPTPAGEGKTTTSIGLADALNRLGRRAALALREPSLGPCFGSKGGAAGGGYAQIVPMDEINLHFNGDFHAVTSANNLLSALIDNSIYWDNPQGLDPQRITWRRCLDMNDRSLRGPSSERGFDITVASEMMAILCLATSLSDLRRRISEIVVATRPDGGPVKADAFEGVGAMTALLRQAVKPNLVQTLEHTPALVHGGPFANIAHGCNSVIATGLALKLADYVVTEAGFGADLGAEKFFDIKCRQAGLRPDAVVVVATARALKFHGGVDKAELGAEDCAAVQRGMANLERHLKNIARFGVPAVVAVNRFAGDTEAELATVIEACRALGVEAHVCTHWSDGGAGAVGLAEAVLALADGGGADFRPLYPDDLSLAGKIETIAAEIYGAAGAAIAPEAAARLQAFEAEGYGALPVCMAKSQYSFSADPKLRGAPTGHILPVREVRLSAGAGFVVALCGSIMTMPGLPRFPSARGIDVTEDGLVTGLS